MGRKLQLLILFLLINISFISADLISINSGGSDNLIINPSMYIEDFFLSYSNISVEGEIVTISVGGGGGENIILKYKISSLLCNLTYNSSLKNQTKYQDIYDIMVSYKNLTGNETSFTEVKIYIDNWKELCAKSKEITIIEKIKEKKNFWLIFILIFIIVLLLIAISKKNKIIALFFTKKNFQKRFIKPIDE